MKKLNIAYVATESVPFAKVGGLADVVGALAKTIKKTNPNSNIFLFLPFYRTVRDFIVTNHIQMKLLTSFEVKMDDKKQKAEVFEISYENINCYFINQPFYFNRDGIYVDLNTGSDYLDSLERFTFFSKAVLETLKRLNIIPDIIQVNDWQTSLIPVFIKTDLNYKEFFEKTKCILLIHNLSYQGIFSVDQYNITGLDWKHFNKEELEFYGYINLLKGGIVYSDCIITVSETYAREIQTVEYGNGLEDILQKKNSDKKLFGIVNGVDYEEWDPSKDIYLKNKYNINYDFESLDNKIKIKKMFLEENGIKKPDISKPVVSIISRLVDQKGFDIIFQIIEEIINLGVYFVALGTGKKEYEQKLKEIKEKYPSNVITFIEFNVPLSHYIEAASDIFILPSRFEPCGLNQLYSLRYGAIPVARRTGGLADTLKNNENAFLFEKYSPEEFLNTLQKAVDTYKNDKVKWLKMLEKGMKERWDWEKSAKKYLEIYFNLL